VRAGCGPWPGCVLCVRSIDGGLLGPEHLILSLGDELQRRGVRVVVANIWDGRPPYLALHAEARRRGLESHVLRQTWGTDPRVCLQLLRLMRNVRPDVVYTHDQKSEIAAVLASRIRPTALVGGYYGRLAIYSRRIQLQEATSRVSLRFYKRVLANSKAQADELHHWGLPAGAVTVLPSFVDTRALEPATAAERASARRALDIDDHQPVLTTVARLSAQKGHTFMLQALERVRQSYPDMVYLVVGDAESAWHGESQRAMLAAETIERDLSGNVRFLGQRDDLHTLLHATDVLISPSLREGMSVILLNAMAAGLPIVATAVGGSPEVVEDERTGLLVPPADAAALAQAISRLLADGQQRAAFGAAGRQRVEARFDARVIADHFLTVCSQVMAHA
jgi:glycosyltransferase involved in cell wall biosynthesis